jgi:hypothetical protein
MVGRYAEGHNGDLTEKTDLCHEDTTSQLVLRPCSELFALL